MSDNKVGVFSTGGRHDRKIILRGHAAPVTEAIFAPNGDWIATWSLDGMIKLWNAQSGEQVSETTLKCDRRQLTRLDFSRDSSRLVVNGHLRENLASFQVFDLPKFAPLAADYGHDAIFGEHSNQLLYRELTDQRIVQLEIESGTAIGSFEPSEGAYGFTLLAPTRTLAVATGDGGLELFDMATRDRIKQLSGHRNYITDVVSHPDGQQFVTCSWDGTLRMWHTKSDAERRTIDLDIDTMAPAIARFSPDGKHAVVANVRRPLTELLYASDFSEHSVLEGQFLLELADGRIATRDKNRVMLWDPKTTRLERTLQFPANSIFRMTEMAAGLGLVAHVDDSRIVAWDAKSDSYRELTQAGEVVHLLFPAPEPDACLMSLGGGRLERLDLRTLERSLYGQFEESVIFIDYSNDMQRALITLHSGRAVLWDVAGTAEIVSIGGQETPITEAHFALDGKHLAGVVGLETKMLGLWNLETQELVREYKVPGDTGWLVRDSQMDAANEQLALALGDAGAVVWDLADGELSVVTTQKCMSVTHLEQTFQFTSQPTRGHESQLTSTGETAAENLQPKLIEWAPDTQSVTREVRLPHAVHDVQVVNDGTIVIASSLDYSAEVIPLSPNDRRRTILGQNTPLILAEFIDDERILTVGANGLVIEHATVGNSGRTIVHHTAQFVSVSLTPDRRLLYGVDRAGASWKVDLKSGDLSSVDLPPLPQGFHEIGPSGNSMISAGQNKQALLWDARSVRPQSLSVEANIARIVISPDASMALLIPSPAMTQARLPLPGIPLEPETDQHPDAWIVNLDTLEKTPIRVSGGIVTGVFSTTSREITLLSSHGELTRRATDKVDHYTRLGGGRAYLRLFKGGRYHPNVYAYHSGGMEIFEPTHVRHGRELRITSELPHMSFLPMNWQVSNETANWMLLPQGSGAARIPKDIVAYVSQLPPRPFNEEETERFSRDEEIAAIRREE